MTDRPIVALDFRTPDPEAISQAIVILKAGGLVVAPTETRYGLLGRADKAEVVEKVYRLKGRPLARPMAMFVTSFETIAHYAELNSLAQFLAKQFLPGPLTLILKALAEGEIPVARDGKIGIRISSMPVIQRITEKVGFPLTATSANASGSSDLNTITQIQQALGNGVDLYLESGVLKGASSTVVDCSGGLPRIFKERGG